LFNDKIALFKYEDLMKCTIFNNRYSLDFFHNSDNIDIVRNHYVQSRAARDCQTFQRGTPTIDGDSSIMPKRKLINHCQCDRLTVSNQDWELLMEVAS
jgi:hypothetical protein